MQRTCNKCNRVIEQLNKEWLGNLRLVAAGSKSHSCAERKGEWAVLLEHRHDVGLGNSELQLMCLHGGHTDSDALRNREGKYPASPLSYAPVSIPCLPSAQCNQKPARHGRQPEKRLSTQFSWDTERIRERQRMAQIVVIQDWCPGHAAWSIVSP